MKTFNEWMESSETIRGWKDMPRNQKELIHYHRLSEKYGSQYNPPLPPLAGLLRALHHSLMCRGVADKYRKRLRQLKASFDAHQVPSIFD